MKKHLLAGLALALVGSAAAIGSAYALYKKSAEDIEVKIGARTTKDIKYTITDPSWNEGSYNTLQPGVSNTLNFTIGGEAVSGGVYSQDVVVGKLTIEITSTDSDVIDYFDTQSLKATVAYTKLDGDKDCFWAKEQRNEVALAKSEGKLVGSKELAVAMTGNAVTLPIALPSDISAEDMLKIAESTYSVKILWDEPTAFEFAYVCGSMASGSWEKVDNWRMVPMINTEDFEWKYILTAAQKAEMVEGVNFKCHNGGWSANWDAAFAASQKLDWIGEGEGYGNARVPAEKVGKVKGIYWKGQKTSTPEVTYHRLTVDVED